jgi:ribosomal protein L35AE/L33A
MNAGGMSGTPAVEEPREPKATPAREEAMDGADHRPGSFFDLPAPAVLEAPPPRPRASRKAEQVAAPPESSQAPSEEVDILVPNRGARPLFAVVATIGLFGAAALLFFNRSPSSTLVPAAEPEPPPVAVAPPTPLPAAPHPMPTTPPAGLALGVLPTLHEAPPSEGHSDQYRAALAAGEQAYRKGSVRTAIPEFRKALAQEPESSTALVALASALDEVNQTHEAIQLLLKALRLNPKNGRARLTLGTIYQTEGRSGQAVAAYHKYLQQSPHGEFANDVRIILANLRQ